MERKIAIQEAAEASLRNIIGKNGGNKDGEIFSQLAFLTDKIETFGEERLFIALPVKEALVRMLDADAQYSYDVNQSKDGSAITVTCYLKWSDRENYSGIGTCTRFLPSIFRFDSLTEEERKEKWVKTCKSLARADAIRDALALSAYDFDESDLQIADEEKKKVEKEFEKKVPEIASPEEKKAKQILKNVKKSAPIEEKVEEEVSETAIQEEEPIALSNEDPLPFWDMDLDDALLCRAKKGICSGMTLKEILDAKPKNLIWLMNNDESVSYAAKVVVENTPELKELVS